jgi:hypothetical protein
MNNKIRKSVVLIGLGAINLLHASMHIIQFIQSVLLVKSSIDHHTHQHDGFLDDMLHNPYLAFIWAIVGLFTLWIGIKDFYHHKKCNHKSD